SEGAYNLSGIFTNVAHPFVSLLYVGDLLDLSGVRFFYDYIQGFLFYLRAFGINFGDSLTYFNTDVLMGIRESIVPPGYLAFGYAQALYLGVFVSGLFYRSTFKVLT